MPGSITILGHVVLPVPPLLMAYWHFAALLQPPPLKSLEGNQEYRKPQKRLERLTGEITTCGYD